jgi:hypothetical protein
MARSGRPIYRFVKPLVGSSNLPPGTVFSPDQRATRKRTEVAAVGPNQACSAQGHELPGVGPGKTRRKSLLLKLVLSDQWTQGRMVFDQS